MKQELQEKVTDVLANGESQRFEIQAITRKCHNFMQTKTVASQSRNLHVRGQDLDKIPLESPKLGPIVELSVWHCFAPVAQWIQQPPFSHVTGFKPDTTTFLSLICRGVLGRPLLGL